MQLQRCKINSEWAVLSSRISKLHAATTETNQANLNQTGTANHVRKRSNRRHCKQTDQQAPAIMKFPREPPSRRGCTNQGCDHSRKCHDICNTATDPPGLESTWSWTQLTPPDPARHSVPWSLNSHPTSAQSAIMSVTSQRSSIFRPTWSCNWPARTGEHLDKNSADSSRPG